MKTRKLTLNKQTMRNLTPDELDQANGGTWTISCTVTLITVTCTCTQGDVCNWIKDQLPKPPVLE